MVETNQLSVTCPYCNRQAWLVNGSLLYPHRPDLHDKQFYACVPCGAHVGCHPGTTRPLGQPANAELRQARMAAHSSFDRLWRKGTMTRNTAYEWLRRRLRLARGDCHIGHFDLQTCQRVVEVCRGHQTGLE